MTTDPTANPTPTDLGHGYCPWCHRPNEEHYIGRARHEQECRGRVFAALQGYAAMVHAKPEVQQWIKRELESAREWGD